jgi:hypothetical protein
MGLLFVNGVMELLILANGKIAENKDRAPFSFQMALSTKENSLMISQTVLALRYSLMEVFMKEIFCLVCSMEKEDSSRLRMVQSTKAIGSKIK